MLASATLEEDVFTSDQQVEVVRITVGDLAGETVSRANLRPETGCTVVALEPDDALITDLDATFTFEAGKEVVVAGPDTGIAQFNALVRG